MAVRAAGWKCQKLVQAKILPHIWDGRPCLQGCTTTSSTPSYFDSFCIFFSRWSDLEAVLESRIYQKVILNFISFIHSFIHIALRFLRAPSVQSTYSPRTFLLRMSDTSSDFHWGSICGYVLRQVFSEAVLFSISFPAVSFEIRENTISCHMQYIFFGIMESTFSGSSSYQLPCTLGIISSMY